MLPCVSPNQPATPTITVRVAAEMQESLRRIAADNGETLTAVVLRALSRLIREESQI